MASSLLSIFAVLLLLFLLGLWLKSGQRALYPHLIILAAAMQNIFPSIIIGFRVYPLIAFVPVAITVVLHKGS